MTGPTDHPTMSTSPTMSTQNNTPAPQWQPITPENPPVFPCWLWHRPIQKTQWQWTRFLEPPREICPGALALITHWHPDQPTAPTVQPEQPERAQDIGELYEQNSKAVREADENHRREHFERSAATGTPEQPSSDSNRPCSVGTSDFHAPAVSAEDSRHTPMTDSHENLMRGQTFTAQATYAYTFARQLERDLNTARAEVERLNEKSDMEQRLRCVMETRHGKVVAQLATLRSQLAASRPTAEMVEACANEISDLTNYHEDILISILTRHLNPEKKP